MPPPIDKKIKETAVNMLLSGLGPSQVANELGLPRTTVKNWLAGKPKNLGEIRAMAKQALEYQAPKVAESRLSQLVRSNLGKAVSEQASVLAASAGSVTLEEMKNTPDGQGLAAVTKTVIESAEKVFGWSQEGVSGLVSLGDLEAIDVESTTTPSGDSGDQSI